MSPIEATPILVDQVYRSLLGAIADCTLRPGQRILQADLATSLGVSRQPVSHALQLLKYQGLVQDAGRKGLAVTPIDAGRIRQLYEVRGALDALSARLAAARVAEGAASVGQRAALEDALAAGQALGNASLPHLVQADVTFHHALYELSGNPAILETLDGQWPHLRRSMGVVLAAESYRKRAWDEHGAIAAAILAGAADLAARFAFEHAETAGRETADRLQAETPPR